MLKIFRFAGNRKPAVVSGGLPGGVEPSQAQLRNMPNMTAIPLFNKSEPRVRAPNLPRVSPIQQVKDWLKQGARDVFTVNLLVTPDIARVLLAKNDSNRPIIWGGANRSVAAYAEAMKRGEWTLNGEAIILASTGELNDGQHRLFAVIESGVAVMMTLTFGVERDTRHTVDQGVARSPGHILAMMGEKDANNLASALQYLWTRDAGVSLNNRPSPDQLLATLERHPGVRDTVRAANAVATPFRVSRGYLAAAHYECQKVDPFAAEQFFTGTATGLNIQNVNSAISRLRKAYTEHCSKRKPLTRIEQAALYIKAFNMFRRGRTGMLVWRDIGPSAEAFPTVDG